MSALSYPCVTRLRNEKEEHLQKYADQARKAEKFNDVCIKTGTVSFSAHRLVLGCYSQFFEKLFESPMKEQYEKTVELNELDGDAVRLLVDYMYKGSINISHENVYNLLAAANFFQMNEICQYCFEYLKDAISIENWPAILSALQLYTNDMLTVQLNQFFSENIEVIANTENFLQLSTKDLIYIIENLNKAVTKESSIYEAILKWLRYDQANRKSEFSRLFLLLNLNKLSCDYLQDVVAFDPLVKENNNCLNAVMSAFAKQFRAMRFRESGSKLISVAGHFSDTKVTEVYSLVDEAKSVYPDLPKPVYYAKALKFGNFIYSIGGSLDPDVKTITNKVYRMNLTKAELNWEEICPMIEERCWMGAATFKDCIVVAGGSNNEVGCTAEFYFPALNKWQRIVTLDNCDATSIEVVPCNDCLYVLGGINKPENSVKRLRDLGGQWEFAKPMNTPRASCAAVSCNDLIYVIGGLRKNIDGKDIPSKTVELYDPVQDNWSYVGELNIERWGHAACTLQGKVFVVGGMDATDEAVLSIECYDPSTDKWTIVSEIKDKLGQHSLVAI